MKLKKKHKAARPICDSYANFKARVGISTDNLSARSHYSTEYLSRNIPQLEAMYRSSWIVGQAVDVVADDMTRAGIELSIEDPEDKRILLHQFEQHLIWDRINELIRYARLYGGAIAVMLIDGQDVSTPLNLDTVGLKQFKGLYVFDRTQLQPSVNQYVTDFGPQLGQPLFYDVTGFTPVLGNTRLHHSRVLRMDGIDLPYRQRLSENLWGMSVVERIYDRLLAFDSTTQGIAQLVFKAHLRVLKIEDLRMKIGAGGDQLEELKQNISMIREYQSNEGLTLLDSADDFQTNPYNFGGLDSVLLQFGQQLSGALGIPMVRLFGQSPAGLNSTGESDIRLYYDNIKQQQEKKLREPLLRLLHVMQRSCLGYALDDDWQFEFKALWQTSDSEKAEIATKQTKALIDVYDAGLISRQTALMELRGASSINGLFSHITDEDIKAAEEDPPEPIEIENDHSES